MVIANFYTALSFDSKKKTVGFLKKLITSSGIRFSSYGTSESSNKAITDKSIPVMAQIFSDYPFFAFGEIYLRTKGGKIVMRINNRPAAINRWTLFIDDDVTGADFYINLVRKLILYLTDNAGVFFMGLDKSDEILEKHTIRKATESGSVSDRKAGLDDITQLPGIYWITYLSRSLVPGGLTLAKNDLIRIEKMKHGFLCIAAEVCTDKSAKSNAIERLSFILPKDLVFDKAKGEKHDFRLGAVVEPGSLKPFNEISVPAYDFSPEELDFSITAIAENAPPRKYEDIYRMITDAESPEDFSKIFSAARKMKFDKWEKKRFVYIAGMKIGDIVVALFKGEWKKLKPVFLSVITIVKLSPKTFSPFGLIYQIIDNDLVYEDFLEEFLFYK